LRERLRAQRHYRAKKRKIYKNFISPQLGFLGWIGPDTGGSISNERNPAWMRFIH
jgi:hypothetical protein